MILKTKHVTLVLFLSIITSPVITTAGEVEITLLKFSDNAGGFSYGIDFDAIKAGATTCELTTPSGATACTKVGDEFSVNRTNLTWDTMSSEASSPWTLVLDDGLSTETAAIIDLGFGTVDPELEESTWLAVPIITTPSNGTPSVLPNTSFDWTYTIPTNEAQLDTVEVELQGPISDLIESDELALTSTSWTPDMPLVQQPVNSCKNNGYP